MKKTLALVLCLLLAAALFGCGGDKTDPDREVISIHTPAPSGAPDPDQAAHTAAPDNTDPASPTAVPIPAATDAPVLPTEEPFIAANADEAEARYQGYYLGYDRVYRDPLPPNAPIVPPRYTLGADGIYHSSTASNDNEASIMFTGDLMCQERQQIACRKGSTFDFNDFFYYMKDLFSKSDLLVGNLEGVSSASAPYMCEVPRVDDSPHLNAPSVFLETVRSAGFDAVVMANNHACDAGVRGIYETLDRVEEYGLIHTGTFRNTEEPRFVVIDVDGIRIGLISYATYFNHKDERITREGQNAMLNYYSPERVSRDAALARAAGAEYIFCYIHWGVEYQQDPNATFTIPAAIKFTDRPLRLLVKTNDQPRIAQELADAGVDYILGSHPHALQPYDVITASDGRRVPVIYSLGNFVSHQQRNITRDTIVLRVVLTRDPNGKVVLAREGYVPAHLLQSYNGRNYPVIPLTYPYRKDNAHSSFSPAYYRIVQAIGPKLPVMGTL